MKSPYARLKIPKKIRLLGIDWAIKRMPYKDMPSTNGEISWACVMWREQTIYISNDYSPERMTLLLCHEVAHLLVDAMGIAPPESESLAERLERPLASLLSENQWLHSE